MSKLKKKPERKKLQPDRENTDITDQTKDDVTNQIQVDIDKQIKENEEKIKDKLNEFKRKRGGQACFPLLMGESSIINPIVDDTFDELKNNYKNCGGKLDVIVDSGGGDLDAAYNLANLFRRYGKKELNFIVPRWAKSAATLLACAGNKIFMTPVAELGPLDPQITEINPMEKRLEQFSPLHIEATLELIRNEFKEGHDKLADGLMKRLQFPLTLGSFKKSLDIAQQYLKNLLSTRMFSGDDAKTKAELIAKQLTTGYADHGYSINSDEARSIGLTVVDLKTTELDIIWEIHKLNREIIQLERKKQQGKLSECMENLPPDMLNRLPEQLQEMVTPKKNGRF